MRLSEPRIHVVCSPHSPSLSPYGTRSKARWLDVVMRITVWVWVSSGRAKISPVCETVGEMILNKRQWGFCFVLVTFLPCRRRNTTRLSRPTRALLCVCVRVVCVCAREIRSQHNDRHKQQSPLCDYFGRRCESRHIALSRGNGAPARESAPCCVRRADGPNMQ